MVVGYASAEISVTIIRGALRSIYDVVLFAMSLIQERCYLINRIAIQALEAACRVTHRDDPVRNDVSKIQTELSIIESSSIAGDLLASKIKHFYNSFYN